METSNPNEPTFRITMRLNAAVGVDVPDRNTAGGEHSGDEYAPVAFERVTLRAHKREAHALTPNAYSL